MTEDKSSKFSSPFVIIGLIAVAWVSYTIWSSLGGKDDQPLARNDRPTESTTTSEDVSDSTDTVLEPVAVPEYIEDESAGLVWSTYHGGSSLTGLSNVSLPDKLKVVWRHQIEGSVYYPPVSDGERIYFTSYKGGVFALDTSGEELWSRELVREIRDDGKKRMELFDAPIAYFNGTVFAGAMRGNLYAFDAASGKDKWVHDLDGPILGTVNTENDDSLIILGQEYGTLHSIDMNSGKELWQTEGIDRCDGSPSVHNGRIVFGSCAAAIHVFSTEDGELLRNIEIDTDSQIAGGVALVGDSAFSGSHSGKLIHANARTGEIVWINEDSTDEILSTPAVNRDFVVFSCFDDFLYAVDRVTGELRWKFDTEGYPTSPIIVGDKVLLGVDGVLHMLRLETGESLWSYEVSDEITSPAVIQGMVVVGSDDGTITAFGADGA